MLMPVVMLPPERIDRASQWRPRSHVSPNAQMSARLSTTVPRLLAEEP